ncbi:MAG: hypothetical protein LBK96_01670 [Prevotellaceae bacterium]|jgi:hypothetical protein|nr:hypothetical protein [Prevotellaceae bacterium]
MIVVLELNQTGKSHVPVNSAFLKVIEGFPGNKLCFFSEREHSRSVRQFPGNDVNVEYHPFTQIKDFRLFPVREIISFLKLIQVLFFVRMKGVKLLFITSISPPSHFVLKLLFPLFKCRAVVTLHGELEFLRENKKGFWKCWGKILKASLCFGNSGDLKYLVLGEIIRNNLLQTVKLNPDSVLSIDHPFIYSDIKNKTLDERHLRLGSVGVASLHKKSYRIFQLAEDFKEEIAGGRIRFEIVGRVLPNMHSHVNEYVDYSSENDLIDRDSFEDRAANLDYLLFFYDNDFYRLCSSGAFFDAVNFEKPVLAIKNDFFCYYFNRLGNIGYLFDSETELSLKVKELLNDFPVEEYNRQAGNLKKAKEILSLSSISVSLYNQLNS